MKTSILHHRMLAGDWDRKPSHNHERQPRVIAPQPVAGWISARCKMVKHCECYALKCSCECHTRGG